MLTLQHDALGAQLLGATLPGLGEVFYRSPWRSEPPGPVRGGVPVLFPQFADTGPLAKHGFARNRAWCLERHEAGAAGETLRYVLALAPGEVPDWPHAARLSLLVQARPERLRLALSVENTGPGAFAFTGGLHPYFAVPDLLQARLDGLQGVPVHDRYAPSPRVQEGPLAFTGEPLERLHDGCPPLRLQRDGGCVVLSATGFEQWMVWNPGREGARALADLPDDDWRRFVCIEPVVVRRPLRLAPGERFSGTLEIGWQPTA